MSHDTTRNTPYPASDAWGDFSPALPYPAIIKTPRTRQHTKDASKLQPSHRPNHTTSHSPDFTPTVSLQKSPELSLLGHSMQPLSLPVFPSMGEGWDDDDEEDGVDHGGHEIFGHLHLVPLRASSPPRTPGDHPIPEFIGDHPHDEGIPTLYLDAQNKLLKLRKPSLNPMFSYSRDEETLSRLGLSTTADVSKSMASGMESPQQLFGDFDMQSAPPEHIYPCHPRDTTSVGFSSNYGE